MNGEGEQRIMNAFGALHFKLDQLDTKADGTNQEVARLTGKFEGQERWMQDLQRRHEEETRSTRKEIVRVDRRVAGLERADTDTTQQRQALGSAQAQTVLVTQPTPVATAPHGLREAASETVEIVKWKALVAMGTPIALAVAGWITWLTTR